MKFTRSSCYCRLYRPVRIITCILEYVATCIPNFRFVLRDKNKHINIPSRIQRDYRIPIYVKKTNTTKNRLKQPANMSLSTLKMTRTASLWGRQAKDIMWTPYKIIKENALLSQTRFILILYYWDILLLFYCLFVRLFICLCASLLQYVQVQFCLFSCKFSCLQFCLFLCSFKQLQNRRRFSIRFF